MPKINRTEFLHLITYSDIKVPVLFNDLTYNFNAIDEDFKDISGRVDDLNTRVTNVEERVTSLEECCTSVQDTLNNHTIRIQAIEEVIDTVSTQNITDLQSRISALENKVQTNAEQIHELNDNVSSINTRLDGVDRGIVELGNRTSSLEGRVGVLETCCVTVEDTINAHDIRISKNTEDIESIRQRLSRDESNIQGNADDIIILSEQVQTNAHNIDELTHALDELDPTSQLEIVRQVAQNTSDIASLKEVTTAHTQRLDGFAVRFTNDELRITSLENRMTDIEEQIERIDDWQEQIDNMQTAVDNVVNVVIPQIEQELEDDYLMKYDSDSSDWVDDIADLVVANDGKAATSKVVRLSKAEYDAEFVADRARLSALENGSTTVVNRVSALEDRVALLDDSTTGRVTVLEGEVTDLETDVGVLEGVVGNDALLVGSSLTNAVNLIYSRFNGVESLLTSVRDFIGWVSASQTFDTLLTTAQTIVGAINEVLGRVVDVEGDVGDLTQLHTTDKSNVVNAVNEVSDAVSITVTAVKNALFPVGCVYLTINNTNPAVLLGFGTWTMLDSGYLRTGASNATGGSMTTGSHALTTNEIPSHRHTIAHTHSGTTGTGNFTTNVKTESVQAAPGTLNLANPPYASGTNNRIENHTHDFTTGNPSNDYSGYTGSGVGHTHSIEPTYTRVYAWKRTA